jgi:amidohydrolase
MSQLVTTRFSPSDLKELVDVRRDLHAHPELAFEEVRTAGVVAERLKALGLPIRTQVGRTGVVGTVKGGRAGKTVMLRADMDALPIQEDSTAPYRSQVPGKMHACGHDCHTSILLGVSKQLASEASTLPGAVRLCFQPAEESGGGALAMIADGALADPKPDATFGLHVWQDLDLGTIGITPGPFMAAVDEFQVTLTGKGAHAAMPHFGVDPVVCAAQVITGLQTIASRETSPLLEVVVSVTKVQAGTAFNIIPGSVTLGGTCRAFDEGVWKSLPERFERVVRGIAAAHGCTAEVSYQRHNRPTVNDPAMAALAREAAIEVVGEKNVVDHVRTMGGEDFSWFLVQVPGCFIAIGSRNAAKGLTADHHHPRFDVDEGCLEIGAEVLLRTTRRFLERG